MDFCQAGARQGGDEAEAGGEGEGLDGIILYHLTRWGTRQKGDINPVTTPSKWISVRLVRDKEGMRRRLDEEERDLRG